ncbi:MAG: hypothetical protein LBT24_04040 [Tannerella sp.]|nr:hypothetical protein [Tannerella sp.]
MRDFGFGTRVYSRDEYKDEFESLLSCYVESGIPVIVAIEDRAVGIGHALLAIGHEKIDNVVDAIKLHVTNPVIKTAITKKNLTVYDYDSIEKKFVFVDDNHPVYQKATLKNPAAHYPKEWHNCKITYSSSIYKNLS